MLALPPSDAVSSPLLLSAMVLVGIYTFLATIILVASLSPNFQSDPLLPCPNIAMSAILELKSMAWRKALPPSNGIAVEI